MQKFCFALDLRNDPAVIADYDRHHAQVWPEIERSIYEAGVTSMEIYRTGNRLVLIMETPDDFSPAHKAELDAANPKVQEWEALMSTMQKPVPWAAPGVKWVLMERIYRLPAR